MTNLNETGVESTEQLYLTDAELSASLSAVTCLPDFTENITKVIGFLSGVTERVATRINKTRGSCSALGSTAMEFIVCGVEDKSE